MTEIPDEAIEVATGAEITAAAEALIAHDESVYGPVNSGNPDKSVIEVYNTMAEAALEAAERERHPHDQQVADCLKATARTCRGGNIPYSGDLEYMEDLARIIEARTQPQFYEDPNLLRLTRQELFRSQELMVHWKERGDALAAAVEVFVEIYEVGSEQQMYEAKPGLDSALTAYREGTK